MTEPTIAKPQIDPTLKALVDAFPMTFTAADGVEVARGAHAPADLEAIDAGHHHVKDYRVDGPLGEAIERLLAVDRQIDVVLVESQRPLQCPPDGGLVIYNQNLWHVS